MRVSLNTIKLKYVILIFFILSLVYAGITLLLPPNENTVSRYNLTTSEAKALSLTVVVPVILIWSAAAYGYWKLRSYAAKIRKNTDGKALGAISEGLLVLALWLPISSVVSSGSRRIYESNPSFTEPLIIFSNYINLFLALSAFYLIYKGASKLPNVLKELNSGFNRQTIFWPLYGIIAAFFTYFTLKNPARQYPTEGVKFATYYLPDWLLVITIIIPSLAVMYFGLRSVAFIFNYSMKAPGMIYKKALNYIAAGILVVVLSQITLKMLSSFTPWFEDQSLKIILAVLYFLLIFIGVGYLLIARGAKKLQKIEEVK